MFCCVDLAETRYKVNVETLIGVENICDLHKIVLYSSV